MDKNEEDPSIQLGKFLGNTFENSQERIRQKLNKHLTTPVNIGIVGSRGTGKSMLIRANIDLFPPDPRAPTTGSIHRTRYPAPYLHPESENIVFWDCPGLGAIEPGETTNRFDFTRENYFEKISKLDNEVENEKIKKRLPNFVIPERISYDCFLICGDNGFNQDEADLAKIFSEQNINCYFVKTKFDNDLETIEQNYEDPLTDEQIQVEIDKIRQNVAEILDKRFGLKSFKDRIFIISAMVNPVRKIDNRRLYDFPLLQRAISENMPKEKKNTLIMALLPLVKDDVSTKCNLLRKRINLVSAISGVFGLSPIPGTSFFVDFALITRELFIYAKALNLSKEGIQQMAVSYGINYYSLEQNVLNNHAFVKTVVELNEKSILSKSFLSLVGSRIALALVTFLGSALIANSVEEFLKFIPVIGSIIGSVTSFATTQASLRIILNEFKKTTLELIEYCSENKAI